MLTIPLIKEYGVDYENIGIISFAGSEDNLLMWAHYADKHKWFVICLDEEHPFLKNDLMGYSGYFYKLHKVNY
jgi:hypothetical protein